MFGTPQVIVTQASVTHNLVFLSFKAISTWVYGLSSKAQELIKKEIEGKTTQQAVTLLASSKGIEQVSIQFTGFGDDTRLPKNSRYIHFVILIISV